jgi:serine protease Do
MAIDGQPVERQDALVQTISQKRVGDTITLTIYRNGRTIKVPVKLLRPVGDQG